MIQSLKQTFKLGLPLLAAFALIISLITPAGATYPGVNGKIVYYNSNDTVTYTVQPDGTNVAVLSAIISNTSYSSDGTKIAYTSDTGGNIWVADADGTNPLQVTNSVAASDTNPVFSPDASKIVFQSTSPGSPRIFSVNVDGSGLTQLTNSGAPDFTPTYSPDGSKILFANASLGLRTMNPDGTGAQTIPNTIGGDSAPIYSPDGTTITFWRGVSSWYQVFTIGADGTGRAQLTNEASSHSQYPTFSPDGSKIAFYTNRSGSGFQLYTMNPDGSSQAALMSNLLGSSVGAAAPSWQPLTIPPTSTETDPTLAYAGSPLVYDASANTTDVYGGVDPATLTITTQPTKGMAVVDNTAGTITYTPSEPVASGSLWQQFATTVSNLFSPKVSAQATTSDSYTYSICSEASSELCTTNTVTITGLPDAASPAENGGNTLAPTGSSVFWAYAAAVVLVSAGLVLGLVRRWQLVKQR